MSEGGGQSGKGERSVHRTLAEWVSLGVSCLLIVGLAGFLVYETARGDDPYNLARTAARTDEARQVEAVFILPVDVENKGRRTLRDLEVELTYTPPGKQQPERATKTIDYLGEGSTQTLYFYLDHDPRQTSVHVRPLHYRLD